MKHSVLGSGYLDYRRPVIVGREVTRKWPLSETYEQMRLLRDTAAVASEERDADA